MKYKVAVVVVIYNNKVLIDNLLSSMQKTVFDDYVVIVVDNRSVDGGAELVEQKYPEAVLLRNNMNRFFSGGVNTGIGYALQRYDPDFFIIMNSDTEIIDPCWITSLLDCIENNKRIGMVCCRHLNKDMSVQSYPSDYTVFGYWKPLTDKTIIEDTSVGFFYHSCFIVRRNVVDMIGGFDTGFIPWNFEDADFVMRIRRIGFLVVYTCKTSIIHLGSGTTNKIIEDDGWYDYIHYFNNQKNRLRFFLLNYPWHRIVAACLHQRYYPFWNIFFNRRISSVCDL